MTFIIEDADLDKLHDVLIDINVKKCPWFEVQDKHGNKAKYYRESQSTEPERKKGKWLRSGNCIFPYECDQCEDVNERATPFCPHCGADMREGGRLEEKE